MVWRRTKNNKTSTHLEELFLLHLPVLRGQLDAQLVNQSQGLIVRLLHCRVEDLNTDKKIILKSC